MFMEVNDINLVVSDIILNKIIKKDGDLKGLPQSRKATMRNAAKIMKIVF